jgi:hypothetical protein
VEDVVLLEEVVAMEVEVLARSKFVVEAACEACLLFEVLFVISTLVVLGGADLTVLTEALLVLLLRVMPFGGVG